MQKVEAGKLVVKRSSSVERVVTEVCYCSRYCPGEAKVVVGPQVLEAQLSNQ